MYDLHIHSCLSDGTLDIQDAINNSFGDLEIISFCDHENIFNPDKYLKNSNNIKLISGVELCCNVENIAIEILGYNFDANNEEFELLVSKLRDLRNDLLRNILDFEKMDYAKDLPSNIFRKDIKKYFIKKYGNYNEIWSKYDEEYVRTCHSVSAEVVIESIKAAGGIPVLAHPMESFKGLNWKQIENLILALGVNAIEMVTPKHTKEEMEFIENIANRYNFNVSIGSDTHGQYTGNRNIYNINLRDFKFDWIRKI